MWMGAVYGSDPTPLPRLLFERLGGLAPGVGVSVLFDRACDVVSAAEHFAMLRGSRGYELRTMPGPPQDLLLIDGEVAVIPRWSPADGLRVVVVREPIAVRLAHVLFETLWPGAEPVEPGSGAGVLAIPTGRDPLKQRILQLLAEGAKDEQIARLTGVSLRTCRRHVAAILRELGAVSRFQAGARAALLGLVEG
jgi:DNA-binding CsgD family transcriptional regulator